jgi:lysophospholipid acyltransferase (LPLAT)-like uncharacterized protein
MTASPAPERQTRARARKGGVIVPHRATWRQRLAARLVHGTLRLVGLTTRFRLRSDQLGRVDSIRNGGPLIFAIWHNRLSLCIEVYDYFLRGPRPDRRMAAMVSASRDGAFLARILELFRIEPVRGSTSRRGPQALRELVSWGEKGFDLAITPDGPRGPRYQVQEGAIALAQLTGLPILPISYRLRWKVRLPSWDAFQVPLPFTRCEIEIGDLIAVPRDASDAERESLRKNLETQLQTLSRD